MAALPYMPLFVADYLADTAHLTAIQHGAYLLLIMNYWQRGKPLPNDDVRLAQIAKMSKRDWAHNRAAILEFFTEQDNLLTHSRIAQELSRVEAKSLKCKGAAQASVERRFGRRSTPVEPTDTEQNKVVPLDKSNGADADQILWDSAKAFLKPERADPGSLIGKWCKQYGKEATAQAITKAQLERPAQRIPFIVGCLKHEAEDGWDGMA
jgi:uncharacterized protein YdaU (DUF1376 family)